MTPSMFAREVWLSTITRLVPALMVAVLCASMCATTLLTVGRTASAEAQILAQMEEPQNRQVVVTDRSLAGFVSPSVISALDTGSYIERAVGMGAPRDMKSGALGYGSPLVPVWEQAGLITHTIDLVGGRLPQPGEAVISETALRLLGMDSPSGFLVAGEDEFPVVGVYTARQPFETLDSGGVIALPPGVATRSLHVIARSPHRVADMQRLTLSTLGNPEPDQISVQSPAGISEIHEQVSKDFGGFGRQLLLLVLVAGGLLTAVVVLADTLLRRADLGRRRALGASQSTVVLLVVLRTLLAACAGAIIGTGGGLITAAVWGVPIPLSFGFATAVLTFLSATLAALGPAIFAATRDPVQVLRTP